MQDIVNLAHYFVVQITGKTTNNENRISHAIQSIQQLVQKGWTVETIKQELDAFKYHYPTLVSNIYHIEEIIGNKQPPNNLMDPDAFYYHNRLRKTSKPSQLVFNEETREYERIEEPFYLEMVECFTMDDLLDYWYKSNGMNPNENIIKQDRGRFEYLLKFYDLDELLFMIDIGQQERKNFKVRPITNVFHLEKYLDQAKDTIKAKRNVHQMQGINQIIPRKAVQ